jgi:hypothetical protein
MSNLTAFLMGSLIWDFSCLDVEGNPETLQSFEVWVCKPGVQGQPAQADKLAEASVPSTCTEADIWQTLADPVMQSLQPGTYEFFVRAVDAHGNRSDFSPPFVVSWDRVKPSAPTAVRLILAP